MEVTEEIQEMATAIALGMIVYERSKRSIPFEEAPTKNLILANAEALFGEKSRKDNSKLTKDEFVNI